MKYKKTATLARGRVTVDSVGASCDALTGLILANLLNSVKFYQPKSLFSLSRVVGPTMPVPLANFQGANTSS